LIDRQFKSSVSSNVINTANRVIHAAFTLQSVSQEWPMWHVWTRDNDADQLYETLRQSFANSLTVWTNVPSCVFLPINA